MNNMTKMKYVFGFNAEKTYYDCEGIVQNIIV